MRHQATHVVATAFLATALLATGCGRRESNGTGQSRFNTPDEAVTALVAALEHRDRAEVARLLGPNTEALLSSGDAVADSTAREAFLAKYRVKHELVAGGPDDLVLRIGDDGWPFPIPIVRRQGRWFLDGAAGADEIVSRRIGANELRTIEVMHGFVAAERDYAAASHDGAPGGIYARTIRSEPGKHNGLYWEVAPGEPESPAGPLLAGAAAEGYTAGAGANAGYHGYRYRVLTAQGPGAEGGARDYVVNGKLMGGFALVAWPVNYGVSGVMTFLVNQDGVVWQRDLGGSTEQVARSITQFDPDSTWTPIPSEE
jgi:hypothetical protein